MHHKRELKGRRNCLRFRKVCEILNTKTVGSALQLIHYTKNENPIENFIFVQCFLDIFTAMGQLN